MGSKATKAEIQQKLDDALFVIQQQEEVINIANEQINAICNGIQAVTEQQSEIKEKVQELNEQLKHSRPDKPSWLD
jgi:chaperonin cofactor prefoldin